MLWAPVHGKAAVATGAGEDEDDGSGSAWIKKRREARAAREREEQAKKEAEAAAAAAAPTATDGDATPVPAPTPAPEAAFMESTSAVTTPKGESAPYHTGESSEYTHTTLCLPAAPIQPRHHRTRSGLSTVSENTIVAQEGMVGELELDETVEKAGSDAEGSSPADSTEDVSAAEDEGEDESALEAARVTAKGASVEFISKRKRVA